MCCHAATGNLRDACLRAVFESFAAESETKQNKLLEYLDRVASSEEPPVFDGLITDVRPMDLMVKIPNMGVRGARPWQNSARFHSGRDSRAGAS